MKRVRFIVPFTEQNKGDTRPIIYPTEHPCWESGRTIGEEYKSAGSVIVAYTPDENVLEYIQKYWTEINSLDQIEILEENTRVVYSSRFPQPDTHDENGVLKSV